MLSYLDNLRAQFTSKSNMKNKFSHLVDLTHTVHEDIPTWSGESGFSMLLTSNYDKLFRTQEFCCVGGLGTHMDAPAHIIKNGKTIAELPLESLIAPVHIIYINTHQEADYAFTIQDIKDYEEKYGAITPKSLVILYSGWGEKWANPQEYRNPDKSNILHFPRLSEEAAKYLLDKDIAGIAVDTLSPDGADYNFPVHKLFLADNKIIIENLVYKRGLPEVGAMLICLPLKLQDGTESPIRAVLYW